jgi:hypothetical protein
MVVGLIATYANSAFHHRHVMFYTYIILEMRNIFQPRYTRGVFALLTHDEACSTFRIKGV